MENKKIEIFMSIIRENKISNQSELYDALSKRGIEITQSSISRHLKKLNVVKVDGYYRLPRIVPGESSIVDSLDAFPAGDNLIVIRTTPGNAPRAGVEIDRANIHGLLGTIAGDDTIFCAVSDAQSQVKVMKEIFSLFKK